MAKLTDIFKGFMRNGIYIVDECPYCQEKYSFRFFANYSMFTCVSCSETGNYEDFVRHMSQDLIYGQMIDTLTRPEQPEGLLDVSLFVPNQLSSVLIPTGFNKLDRLIGGLRGGEMTILTGKRSEGKCLKIGTKVVMYSGKLKNVEDIVVGDRLMGIDSTARIVLSLEHGHEELYDIHQTHGEMYTVTGNHVLCLNERRTQKDIEITVKEYLEQNKTWKLFAKGYSLGIELPRQQILIDPYFLGLWLADGTSLETSITTPDCEVEHYIYNYAEELGQTVSVRAIRGKAKTLQIVGKRGHKKSSALKILMTGLLGNKHIPDEYLYNSKEIRLQLLAGIIDGDGYLNHNSYEITQKRKDLTEQIQYLANSLGLRCVFKECKKTCTNNGVTGTYYRANIYGNTKIIPVKVDRKIRKDEQNKRSVVYSTLSVKKSGIGEYYGFETDGDHKFLLSDFTVTHNSTISGQLALNAVNAGHKVFFYSGELSAEAFQNWIFLQAAGKDYLNTYTDSFGETRYQIDRDYAEPHIRHWLTGNMILYDNRIIKTSESNTILDRATEAIKHFAENGKGNVIFLDGSTDNMQKTMQQMLALNIVNDEKK